MKPIINFFTLIGRAVSFPLRWIARRVWERHDLVLEKKIRREIDITLTHELKTPLTSILAYSELLAESMEKTAGKDDMQAIRLIYKKSREMVRLIDNMIHLSVLEFNPHVFYKMRVDVSKVAVESLNKLKSFFEPDERFRFETNLGDGLFIGANERLIGVAIFEMLCNAYRYTSDRDESLIELTVGKTGHSAFIRVSDNGIGIKSAVIDRVFEKFFRVEEADKATTSGLGIGLTLIKKICDLYGGKSELKSEFGKGSSICIWFPIDGNDSDDSFAQ